MASDTFETDAVVVGGGMAGLSAALTLVEREVEVTVLEKGPRAGGSMYLSNGIVWTYPSMDIVKEKAPSGDKSLQELVIENLSGDLSWLERHGVQLQELPDQYAPAGGWQGNQIFPQSFTKHLVETIRDRGGRVELRTSLRTLLHDTDGSVDGVEASHPDDGLLRIKSSVVVLATGGCQGNAEILERNIIDDADNLWLRSNPWSTGDGVLAAKAGGAKLSSGWGTFYGHNMVAPPAEFDLTEIADATQYYGASSIALDTNGHRFTDESESDMENTLAQDTARLAEGQAYYVIDADLYDSNKFGGSVSTQIDRARDLGALVVKAKSLEELPEELEQLELNGERALQTIHEFNQAIEEGRGTSLNPPRRGKQRKFDKPPYWVVQVQPGITFTGGGVDVNQEMQVLDRRVSSSSVDHYPANMGDVLFGPIPGLYAAGADVGNVHHRHYIGGLAVALVTGRLAGKHSSQNL